MPPTLVDDGLRVSAADVLGKGKPRVAALLGLAQALLEAVKAWPAVVRRAWTSWTSPVPGAGQAGEPIEAALLLRLIAVYLPVAYVSMIGDAFFNPLFSFRTASFWTVFLSHVAMFPCMSLARRGQVRLSSRMFVWLISIAILGAIVTSADPEEISRRALLFFAPTIIFAGIFFSQKETQATLAVIIACIWSLKMVTPDLPGDQLFLNSTVLTLVAAVTMTTKTLRNHYMVQMQHAGDQYASLVASIPDVIWKVDGDQRLSFISPVVETLTGIRPADIVANGRTHWLERIHPDDQPKVAGAYASLAEKSAFFDIQYRVKSANGEWLWFHDRSTGEVLLKGDGAARSGIMTNITAQKRAEEALETSRLQLIHAQKMEAIGRLAGGVAHDVNNYVQGMSNYMAALLNKFDEHDERRVYAEEALAAADHMGDMTRQLVALSRGHLSKFQRTDLNEVLTRVARVLRPVLGPGVRLEVTLKEGLSSIVADPQQIEQVVVNLVLNARDAIEKDGDVRVRTDEAEIDYAQAVRLRVERHDYVLLEVSDTGTGMDEATVERIFDPLYTTKDPTRGTGLGLAIVHSIVERHQAKITVESRPGVGSTFRIYFQADARHLKCD